MRAYEMYMRAECGLSELTIRHDLDHLKRVDDWLRSQGSTLATAGYDEFTAWVRYSSGRGLACTSIARLLNTVRLYLRFIDKAELANRLESPRVPARSLPRIPSREEIAKLIDSAPMGTCTRAILEVLYATGIRAAEACALVVADFHTDGHLTVRQGKGRKDRMVPIGAPAWEAVAAYLAVSPTSTPTDPVFRSAKGSPLIIQSLNGRVRRCGKAIGLKIHAHLLRHTFATHLLRAGANLRQIQEWLGHDQLRTTAIYLHLDITDLKRTIRDCLPRERVARGLPAELTAAEITRQKISA